MSFTRCNWGLRCLIASKVPNSPFECGVIARLVRGTCIAMDLPGNAYYENLSLFHPSGISDVRRRLGLHQIKKTFESSLPDHGIRRRKDEERFVKGGLLKPLHFPRQRLPFSKK